MGHDDSFLLSDSISRRFELSPAPSVPRYSLSGLVSPRTVHTPTRANAVANPASLLGLGRSSPLSLSNVSPNLAAVYRDPFVSPNQQNANDVAAISARVLPSADELDLRLASSDNPTITMELDLDGNVRYLSSAWSQIVGTDLTKIIKKPVLSIIVGDSVEDTLVFANAMHKMIVDDCSYRVTFSTPTNARRASHPIETAEFSQSPVISSHNDLGRQKSLLSLGGEASKADTRGVQRSMYGDFPPQAGLLQPLNSGVSSHLGSGGFLPPLNGNSPLQFESGDLLPPLKDSIPPQFESGDLLPPLKGNTPPQFESGDLPPPLKGNTPPQFESGDLPPPFTKDVDPPCKSSPESVFSDDGYMIQLEAQGIMIHDQKTKLPSHSMWTIKPFAQLKAQMTLPQSLVDILGFGLSILADYMRQVHAQQICDEDQMPPPPTVLCRVCEAFIPSWFMERHLDLCVVEHRVSEELQACQDALSEQRELLNNVIKGSLPDALAPAPLEYKGIAVPYLQIGPDSSLDPSRAGAILPQLIGLIDEALSINPAEQTEDGEIFISPNTEKAICDIIQWLFSPSDEPALIAMIEDTQVLVDDKIESLSRLVSTLQYLEKIKQEVDDRVLLTVRDAIAHIRQERAHSAPRTSNDSASGMTGMPSLSFTPPPPSLSLPTLLKSPQPQRSPGLISSMDLGFSNEYLPALDRHLSSLDTPPGAPASGRQLSAAMLDIAGTPVTARRPVTSSYQRNNLLPDSNTLASSPLLQVVDTESAVDGHVHTPNQRLRGGINGGSFSLSNPQHAALQKSLYTKPPLSPLLVSSPAPSSKSNYSSGGIKDYEVIKPISKGAFGLVFLAKRTLTGEYVAIKCLKKRDMIAKNQVLNIKSERQVMMRQQDSPYVAQLYLSFQSKHYLYLVMEYLSGGDCAALVKTLGTLDVSWACRYIAQVIVGVDDLHMRGIIHRDLKPDNLLIDAKGHIKLTDFGLLRIGIVGRQAHNRPASQPTNRMSHRSSLTCLDAALEFFRASGLGNDDSANPDQGLPLCDRRNSLNMFTLSPTTDLGKLTPQAASPLVMSMPSSQLASPTLAYLEAYPYQSGHRQALFRSRARLGSTSSLVAAPDLASMSRPFHRTLLDSSFAVVEDDYPASPYLGADSPASNAQTYPVAPSYALYDPQQEGTGNANKFVGTPDYLAPEIIEGASQGETSDWWLIGCILFEFLYGYPPFHADLPEKVFANILKGQVDWPPLTPQENAQFCTPEAHDLIQNLLCMDPAARYGSRGAEEIKQHPFFKDINWDTLFTDEPQFVPLLDHPELTDYFDSRGADLMEFPQDNDDDDDEDNDDLELNKCDEVSAPQRSESNTSASLVSHSSHSSLTVPGSGSGSGSGTATGNANGNTHCVGGGGSSSGLTPTGGVYKRDRRGSRLADPTEFGLFHYRNLAVLEKQNKDAINRLKNEHFEHRQSLSLGSADFSPKTGRGRGHSIGLIGLGERSAGSGPVPLIHKRTGSPHLSRGSPVVVRSSSSTSVRLALPHNKSEHTMKIMNLPSTEDLDFGDHRHSPQYEYPERMSHSLFRTSIGRDFSPSLSDTEDSKSLALLRVEKRRLSLRRVLAIRTNADGTNPSQVELSSERLAEWDVLYCEPIPIVCQSVCKILEKCGCVVVTAKDGEDFVQRACGLVKFDLILTATRLAKVEAVDAVRLIKGTNGPNCNTPIIAVTGFAKEAASWGVFDDVLEKPLQLALMQRAIVRALLADEAILSDIDR